MSGFYKRVFYFEKSERKSRVSSPLTSQHSDSDETDRGRSAQIKRRSETETHAEEETARTVHLLFLRISSSPSWILLGRVPCSPPDKLWT